MGTNPPTTLKCGINKCIITLRLLYLLLFECCSAGMEGNSRCLVQLALGDICVTTPPPPRSAGSHRGKKLCAKCLHRDKHTTQNTRAFLGEKNRKKGEEWCSQHEWGRIFRALKALLCCQGLIFLHSATRWASHSERDGHQWQVGLMGLKRKKKGVGGVKLK